MYIWNHFATGLPPKFLIKTIRISELGYSDCHSNYLCKYIINCHSHDREWAATVTVLFTGKSLEMKNEDVIIDTSPCV